MDARWHSFRGWGRRAAPASVGKYIPCYGKGDLHYVVSTATRRLLTNKQPISQPVRCCGGFNDHLRYQLANGHDTAPQQAWLPVVSRSGFMPDGVAQQCPAASMPVTAWSRRPRSPIPVKKQDPTASCFSYRHAYTNRCFPDLLRIHSLSRTSPAHDDTQTSGRTFRLDKYDR